MEAMSRVGREGRAGWGECHREQSGWPRARQPVDGTGILSLFLVTLAPPSFPELCVFPGGAPALRRLCPSLCCHLSPGLCPVRVGSSLVRPWTDATSPSSCPEGVSTITFPRRPLLLGRRTHLLLCALVLPGLARTGVGGYEWPVDISAACQACGQRGRFVSPWDPPETGTLASLWSRTPRGLRMQWSPPSGSLSVQVGPRPFSASAGICLFFSFSLILTDSLSPFLPI